MIYALLRAGGRSFNRGIISKTCWLLTFMYVYIYIYIYIYIITCINYTQYMYNIFVASLLLFSEHTIRLPVFLVCLFMSVFVSIIIILIIAQ